MPKFAPPPPVAPETWRALLAVAADFAELKPWEFMYDSDVVGLIDPVTGETRIGCVLGAAGEVYSPPYFIAAPPACAGCFSCSMRRLILEDLNSADGMDCLKLELVPKRELLKEDLAMLKAAGFKPAGKGSIWPQFRSAEPGWLPWHINQTEAGQLLADLPRLTDFCKLFEEHPGLFDERTPTEIPFVPVTLPDRPLTPKDLDWRPLLPPPGPTWIRFNPAPSNLKNSVRSNGSPAWCMNSIPACCPAVPFSKMDAPALAGLACWWSNSAAS